MKHKHIITTSEWNGMTAIGEDCRGCIACDIENKKKAKQEAKRRAESIKNSEELVCSECGCHICYVDESDLNGSYFYCNDCKRQKVEKMEVISCGVIIRE